MKTQELLDRYEILYPEFADLRRAYTDKDLSSIFRVITDDNKEDLRKLIMEDNTWKLWPLLDSIVETQFTKAFKNFFVNETKIWDDCFSRGQLQSKLWLVNELKQIQNDLGTVFLCAGWYATLSTMLFEKGFKINKMRSFDIDPSCVDIAEIFNAPWFQNEWQFKALTADIHDIDYEEHVWTFWSNKNNRQSYPITDKPDTIINTSCEHIVDFDGWYAKIPTGKLICLQSNDYVAIDEHVNCVKDSLHFAEMAPLSKVLFTGELPLEKYTRYMRIGIR
jgi:hypothetical protein